MIYYLWRIKKYSDNKALYLLFIAINSYIMNEPINKKFRFYLCLLGKKIIAI